MMVKPRKFKAEVRSGHKENAVEVPFDPVAAWGLPPKKLWHGRHGHVVQGKLNGIDFEEGFVVPRAKKFFLLIDKELARAAGVSAGKTVEVMVTVRG